MTWTGDEFINAINNLKGTGGEGCYAKKMYLMHSKNLNLYSNCRKSFRYNLSKKYVNANAIFVKKRECLKYAYRIVELK